VSDYRSEDTALLSKTENLVRPTEFKTLRIQITLCYNRELGDWSIQIDDKWHRHITSNVLEALVEGAVAEAEMSLEEGCAPAADRPKKIMFQ
jgi:hypothetical protein